MNLTVQREFVEIPTDSCHAGNLCRFRGRLYLTWFGGTRESAEDVDIYVTVRDEDGWRTPVCVSIGNIPHWNPVMLARDGGIDLFFKVGPNPQRWWTLCTRLEDDLTFAAPAELVPGDVGGRGPVKNKCIRLKSGRILAPASLEEGTWRPFVDISDDGGASFTKFVPIPLFREGDPVPEDGSRPWCFAKGQGAIQPSFWQTDDGAVHALMRSSEGCLLRSDSTDDGETWCPAYRTVLPNNNSGIDLARMDDGSILLAMNPVSGDWGARTPLSLYLSRDDGNTFAPLTVLEDQPGEYSYPSVLAEGRTAWIAATYDRKRMAVWTVEMTDG